MLGSAFFTAFVGIFDTENDRLGLAESIYTIEGSSMTCNKADCTGAVGPTPIPDPDQDGSANPETSWILLVIIMAAAAAIIILFACWYRRKRAAGSEQSPQVRQSSKSQRNKKRGYGLQDEREDDSDEENDFGIDAPKPMLNN